MFGIPTRRMDAVGHAPNRYPLTAMPFFKTGPLAWNGLLSFWTLFGTYFIWTASMGVCMAKDALRRLHEEPDLEAPRQRKMGGAGASA